MPEPVRDRWLSIGMSVLLHGGLIALLAYGWWHFRSAAPPATPPINATVVDARTLKGIGTASRESLKPKPQPPTPPPVQEGPPLPTPNEVAMREQAAKEEAQHEAEAQQQLLARQQAKAQAKAQAEAEAKAQAEAAQAAQAQAAAKARKLAQEKNLAEARKKAAAKKLAAEKLAQERKLAEEKKLAEQQAAQQAEQERRARIAELQQSLQEEQQAAVASGALASWTSEITSRIQNAWIRPPTAQPGIECVLNVSLVPGGSVTGVSLGQCNGDDAVRQSIQTAVYNASPLPAPPNGVPFPHQLIITFKPTN
jgi:colicin import membrane protein